MAKKIFVRAHLSKGERWVIDFTTFDPATGKERRQRKDFALNEIDDLTLREEVAKRLMDNIEVFAAGQPARPSASDPGHTVKQAIAFAVNLKMRLPRENSRRKYITVSKYFLTWAKRLCYADIPIAEFGKRHARAYWDWFTTSQEYRGRTLNNYMATLRAMWSELLDREMVTENPWTRIKAAREEEKLRRTFTHEERRVVAAHAEATDYWMFRGILLQFYCYIRPVELTRLKFKDFNFSKGTVTVREGNAKQWRTQIKTLPRSILHYFLDGRFEKYPANYFVFGRVGENGYYKMEPGTIAIDETRPYRRHARMLAELKADGRLTGDLAGLTWYSWKDTGISIHTRKTSPVATKDQAGHTSLAVTSLYYHAEEVNAEYLMLENDLFL